VLSITLSKEAGEIFEANKELNESF